MKYLITIFLLFSLCTFAQITITSADINAQYSPGNSTTFRTDTIVNSVDIGQLGSTIWDFSFLTPNPVYDIMVTAVDPATTPYHGSYPGSNLASLSQMDFMGITADVYSYLSVNGSFNSHGNVIDADTILFTETSDPVEPQATFPFTYNSMIAYNGVRTSVMEITGFPPHTTMTTVIDTSKVDAYGPMTLPGGITVDALRIREDEIEIFQGPPMIYERHVSYTFIAKNGASVNVPSDTVQSTSGVINNTASISWNMGLSTDVKIDETLPSDYSLRQNYPNPFNPSTSIEYSIPEESFVELKVYDILGTEVATLVSDQRAAGVYKADFSGNGLASGFYIARITAGKFTDTIKMTLLR